MHNLVFVLLVSASYFWSDALNAFFFGHGLMTPTLLDILMLTGLNISASNRSYDLLSRTDFKIDTRNIGGWKGYIDKYFKFGDVDHREHVAFQHLKNGINTSKGQSNPAWEKPPWISVPLAPSGVSQTQSRSADRQPWRALVVYSFAAEHIDA